jgi:hypothetical protein
MEPILAPANAVHTLISYFLESRFAIVLPSTPISQMVASLQNF